VREVTFSSLCLVVLEDLALSGPHTWPLFSVWTQILCWYLRAVPRCCADNPNPAAGPASEYDVYVAPQLGREVGVRRIDIERVRGRGQGVTDRKRSIR